MQYRPKVLKECVEEALPYAKCPFGSRYKADCSAMALSQTGTLTETPFCIRQLETERIIKEMMG